jgi:hypothetical protein
LKLRRVFIALLCVSILFWAYDCVISPSYPWRYEKVERNFASLRVGMTKEQVIQVVGNPKRILQFGPTKDKMTKEFWVLHFRPRQNPLPVCTFMDGSNVLSKAEMMRADDLD